MSLGVAAIARRATDVARSCVRSDAHWTTHVAHAHLLGAISTEATRFPAGQTVRILDAGCGGGGLIAYLIEMLPASHPELHFDIYGFDVYDPDGTNLGVGFQSSVAALSRSIPGVRWEERFALFPSNAKWPYPDGFFDIIISNQVAEHLRDHDHFFGEIARCLSEVGFSVNLFPLAHVIMEWHVLIPFTHRIRNYDLLTAFIRRSSKLRLGPFRRERNSPDLPGLAARQAEWVVKYTGYITYGELLTITKKHGLLTSMRYSKEFYTQKVRQLIGRPPLTRYSRRRSIFIDWFLVLLLRYLSCVTVVVEKHGRPAIANRAGDESRQGATS